MEVTIYSTATCAYCVALKNYLKSKNIAYQEKHADEDQAVAEELFAKSKQLGVPFTVVKKADGSEVHIVGFDKAKVDQALDLA